jgi:hypothetical protein
VKNVNVQKHLLSEGTNVQCRNVWKNLVIRG